MLELMIVFVLYVIDYLLGRRIPTKSIFYEIQNKQYKYLFTIILISVLVASLIGRLTDFWFVYFSLRIIDKMMYLSKVKKYK